MRITIDIPDEVLHTLLFHHHSAPAEAIKERNWIIEDAATRRALWRYGFSCKPQHYHWYTTSLPIEFNGSYRLPDGSVIRSHGTELRWQRAQ